MKKASLAPRSVQIEKANPAHLPEFGRKLLCDIEAADIARYQQMRVDQDASPKTVSDTRPSRGRSNAGVPIA
jgi:hypothetical protein